MNENLTEIVFVIDASGSMYEMTSDTIGGFNSAIDRHRNSGKEVLVSTVLFNTQCTVLHDRVPIERVEPMTEKEYQANGGTALMDALGGAIHHIGNVHKYAREEDVPGKTMVIVTTDGMENASRRYRTQEVRQMVRKEREKYGWEFVFLGANIDSEKVAETYGISEKCAVNYVNDSRGNKLKYQAVSNLMDYCICRKDASEGAWRTELDKDFMLRGKKK